MDKLFPRQQKDSGTLAREAEASIRRLSGDIEVLGRRAQHLLEKIRQTNIEVVRLLKVNRQGAKLRLRLRHRIEVELENVLSKQYLLEVTILELQSAVFNRECLDTLKEAGKILRALSCDKYVTLAEQLMENMNEAIDNSKEISRSLVLHSAELDEDELESELDELVAAASAQQAAGGHPSEGSSPASAVEGMGSRVSSTQSVSSGIAAAAPVFSGMGFGAMPMAPTPQTASGDVAQPLPPVPTHTVTAQQPTQKPRPAANRMAVLNQ